MCAVCFTGFQAIPVAAAAGRAWWVKRSAVWGSGQTVDTNDGTESAEASAESAEASAESAEADADAVPECQSEFEPAEEHLALA